jgi:hypothetical protein
MAMQHPRTYAANFKGLLGGPSVLLLNLLDIQSITMPSTRPTLFTQGQAA